MITLRPFSVKDALVLRPIMYTDMSMEQIEKMIRQWNKKQVNNRYFEMLAVICDEMIVGMISLYQHSDHVISIGPEIFPEYRRNGCAKEALKLACEKAKKMGYKIVSQQILIHNQASIALHRSLGFETNGYVYTNSKGNQVSIYLKSL